MDDVWCKSMSVPIREGAYEMTDGRTVQVVQGRSGKFYAKADDEYQPGLIYKLRAELEKEATMDARQTLLMPFVLKADHVFDKAEDIMKDGLFFVDKFGVGVPDEDVPALVRAARRYLDRNY